MEKKYYKLYRSLKDAILNGEYPAGSKLPSKRVMADRTGYSLITVESAYAKLWDEGYIEPRERSGYFVNVINALPSRDLPLHTVQHLDEDDACAPSSDFEYTVWFKTMRQVITQQGSKLLAKSPSMGCAVLRNAIADYLARYRNMIADPRRIVIGSGSEQLYQTVVKLLGRDKIYGTEDPCYPMINAVYRDAGACTLPLPLTQDGIASSTLHAGGFDVLHVTPFHSYPTQATATIAKRHEYLNWAHTHDAYIVEDDFDSEFFLPGQPIESLYALDREQRVIYLNTFSKSLTPSMRIGYLILPEPLLPVYEQRLSGFSCSVPVLEQYVLAAFIANGSFERHLNRLRRKLN